MAGIHKTIRLIALLLILLALLCALTFALENRTAYTRDGVHFVSKERMEENIKYEYAKAGEYNEVQVPSDTIVVGASAIPDWALEDEEMPEEKEEKADEGEGAAEGGEDALASAKEVDANDVNNANVNGKYPYAALGIGLLMAVGVVIAIAKTRGGRRRRRRRSLRRR